MVTYNYVKFYVSIIIHLEVIKKITNGHHFQNGRHNNAKIQHCPISSKFDMWVDNDVPNLFPMSGINSGHHNLPIYEMVLKSDNVEFVRYCGGHFEHGDR
jgi:hypothetical protein